MARCKLATCHVPPSPRPCPRTTLNVNDTPRLTWKCFTIWAHQLQPEAIRLSRFDVKHFDVPHDWYTESEYDGTERDGGSRQEALHVHKLIAWFDDYRPDLALERAQRVYLRAKTWLQHSTMRWQTIPKGQPSGGRVRGSSWGAGSGERVALSFHGQRKDRKADEGSEAAAAATRCA